LLTLKSTLTEI